MNITDMRRILINVICCFRQPLQSFTVVLAKGLSSRDDSYVNEQ